MSNDLDFTHDAASRSWVAGSRAPDCDFPLQNLPFGIFREAGANDRPWRGGVAIGDQILCLAALRDSGLLRGEAAEAAGAAAAPTLNGLLARGPASWRALRHALFLLLRDDADPGTREAVSRCLVAQSDARHALPAQVGDYTDFYTSIDHARNIGLMRRPDNPLSPNFQWLPIAYHGRASTLDVSGQQFRRPRGQTRPAGVDAPRLSACAALDYELELGAWIGPGNARGAAIPVGQADRHIFGLSLLNDWSARDIQFWEMAPLGPFLAKNFATTVSPWIVTLDALAPYRCAWERPADHPQPLPYLDEPAVRRQGAYDIQLEVALRSAAMQEAGRPAHVLSRTSFRHQYWTLAQMVAQHTVNGCSLQPGDLLGSGTISGPTPGEAGSMLELARDGTAPVELPGGESRVFLEDGDTVVLRGWCEAEGRARIGFGPCAGTVLPAA